MVRRPASSAEEQMKPLGLWMMAWTCCCDSTVRLPTLTTSPGAMVVEREVTTCPLIRTEPSVMRDSTERRDPNPAEAR